MDPAIIRGNEDYQVLFILAGASVFSVPIYRILLKFVRHIARDP